MESKFARVGRIAKVGFSGGEEGENYTEGPPRRLAKGGETKEKKKIRSTCGMLTEA